MAQTEQSREQTTNRIPVNQDMFSGQWKQMKGTVRSWWGKLTDDDIERIGGEKDKLVGTLQERYGYTKDMAQREIDRRMSEYGQQSQTGQYGQQSYSSTGGYEQSAQQGMAKTYDDVKAKAQEIGSAVSEKAQSAASAVGQKISSVVGTIRENLPQEGSLGSAATAVADKIDSAGSYLQQHDMQDMAKDLTEVIRRYPIQSLLVGLGVGYLMARNSRR